MFQIDIKYDLNIDCKVTQDGFRPTLLSIILENTMFLKPKKDLNFYR